MPDSVRVPAPILVRLPLPVTAPDKVAPLAAETVPPPAPSETALSTVAAMPVTESVPAFKVSAPVPRLLSEATDRVPPLTVVVPV